MRTGSTPLRVVHLVWMLDVGGLEHVVLDLAAGGDPRRFDTTVLCMVEIGAMAERFAAAGVRVETLGSSLLSPATRLRRLVSAFRRLRPDVVHTHNVKPHIHGTIAAVLTRVPVIVNTKHGRNYPTTTVALAVDRLVSRACDCMVAVSEDAARIACDIEWVPERKVMVIRNGIDLRRYRVVTSADPERLRRAVTVARLSPVKDQATLLQAVRLVVDRDPGFHLTIAGDGPLRDELVRLRDDSGLRDHVTFLGCRADVARILADAGQFVLSSISEGISLTLLEAMASGLPVVATEVGGNPEIVVDGATGFLVPPSDPQALAERVLHLIREPETAARLGAAGRRRIEESFSVDATIAHYERLYAELAERRARPATTIGIPVEVD